jgi:hypothetical protein
MRLPSCVCVFTEHTITDPRLTATTEIAHTGVYAKVPRLITLMHWIGLSFQADRFLTDVVEIAAMSSLRDLKYRARIPIEKGCLLYGIMDETNTLREGEVYIATQLPDDHGEWKHRVITHERLVVTRAPALVSLIGCFSLIMY